MIASISIYYLYIYQLTFLRVEQLLISNIADLMDMNLSKFQEFVMDREA